MNQHSSKHECMMNARYANSTGRWQLSLVSLFAWTALFAFLFAFAKAIGIYLLTVAVFTVLACRFPIRGHNPVLTGVGYYVGFMVVSVLAAIVSGENSLVAFMTCLFLPAAGYIFGFLSGIE